MAAPVVIGLDLGTTNCKAIALASDGLIVAEASAACALLSPQPGQAEQDVAEVWRAVVGVLRDLAGQVRGERLAGLCLSGAMHSLLPVGADDLALARALTWADSRAAGQARALRARADVHALYRRTGCPVQAVYYPARLRWWHGAEPEVARGAARFVAIKDVVLQRLTGAWATDVGLASTTGLLDIERLEWDAAALDLADISPECLPRLVPSDAVAGVLTASAAQATGLPAGLPVVAGSSDGALAVLGAGVEHPGRLVITVGTSGAVRRVVDRPWLDAAERTWCYCFPGGRWLAGGAINNGGLALQWVRDTLYSEQPGKVGYECVFAEAAQIPPGAGGVILLPYFAGERSPYWAPEARAAAHGLGLEHGRAHLARAALEGVAFCLADVWEALAAQDEPHGPAILTGAITHSPVWCQIVADVLGVPLAPVEAADASAIGAAMLGHRALGSVETLRLAAPSGATVAPDPERHRLYANMHEQFKSLYHRVYITDRS